MNMFLKLWNDGKRRLFVYDPDYYRNKKMPNPAFVTVCTTLEELDLKLQANKHPNPIIVSMNMEDRKAVPIGVLELLLK